jgi:hypothetical protein
MDVTGLTQLARHGDAHINTASSQSIWIPLELLMLKLNMVKPFPQ